MKKDINFLQNQKETNKKLVMLTCYDYPTAVLQDVAGVDIMLVGDSVGTNILGYTNEKEVKIEDMIHHTKAVARGTKSAYVLGDMPYNTYETEENALTNATKLIEAGADGIKLEGFKPEIVTHLTKNGIQVCGHLGLNPQTDEVFRVKGKDEDEANELKRQAQELQKAGAKMLVVELIPERLGQQISSLLNIPVIGIGAGKLTDGQVQVVNDIMGLTERKFKHAKRYFELREKELEVFTQYVSEVKNNTF